MPDDHDHDPGADPATPGDVSAHVGDALDLDAIEADLAAVEAALERLDRGDYWTDEATGADLDDALLAADPTARRATPTA